MTSTTTGSMAGFSEHHCAQCGQIWLGFDGQHQCPKLPLTEADVRRIAREEIDKAMTEHGDNLVAAAPYD